MSQNIPVIELKEFSAQFGEKQTLDNINYEFGLNKITAIIGPSGSGKSTLLKTLCRLNDRVEGFSVKGEALVNGQNIYSSGFDLYNLRKRVGLIFQKPCMFPKSILENVLFGVKRSRLSKND
jgi:phosphate transport system ATP-binding protein